MNQASHSHWYPSVSILCQTESEIVGRVPDPVVRGCYIWVPIFSCINVVDFDAIVICHLTLTRFRSSQSSATTCIAREDGPSQSYPHPHGRRRFQLY